MYYKLDMLLILVIYVTGYVQMDLGRVGENYNTLSINKTVNLINNNKIKFP